jgi:hypothetical protein
MVIWSLAMMRIRGRYLATPLLSWLSALARMLIEFYGNQ